jgi:hypothetical protein
MEQTFLLIPFEKKNELKEKHKIQWNADKKLWYFEGDLIDDLMPYTIKKIQVDFADKDILKKRLKSMRWDPIEKIWLCSLEDYNIYIQK